MTHVVAVEVFFGHIFLLLGVAHSGPPIAQAKGTSACRAVEFWSDERPELVARRPCPLRVADLPAQVW